MTHATDLVERWYVPGEWDALEAACADHLSRRPDDADVAMLRAENLLGLGRDAEAARVLSTFGADRRAPLADARFPARLGWVLEADGDLDGAIAAHRTALGIDPGCPFSTPHLDDLLRLRDALDDLLVRGAGATPGDSGVMLVHAHGAGFWSEAHHVLGHVLAADIDGRAVRVHWGEGCLFAEPGEDAWPRLFRATAAMATVEQVDAAARARTWPSSWVGLPWAADRERRRRAAGESVLDLLLRPVPLVVASWYSGVHVARLALPPGHRFHGWSTPSIQRAIAMDWLVPHPDLAERAAAFVAQAFAGQPFVALHLRGTDKVAEQGDHLAIVNRELLRVVNGWMESLPDHALYLMTDDIAAVVALEDRYGARVRYTSAIRGGAGEAGIHLSGRHSSRRIGEEMLVDTLVALHAARFAGNRWSNVACMVRALRDWPDGSLALRGTTDASCNWQASLFRGRVQEA